MKKPPGGERGGFAVLADGVVEIRDPPPPARRETGILGVDQYLRTRAVGTGEAAGAAEYSGTIRRTQPSVE